MLQRACMLQGRQEGSTDKEKEQLDNKVEAFIQDKDLQKGAPVWKSEPNVSLQHRVET